MSKLSFWRRPLDNEVHLPSKKKSCEIPTPEYHIVDTYERDYPNTFMQPISYLRAQGARFDIGEFVEYDLDNEDEDWLQEFNSDNNILKPERFESILFKLEVLDHKARDKAGIVTPILGSPIPVLLQLDIASEVIQAIYRYWKEKRERWQKPILRRLQPPPPVNDTDPYNVFRLREKGQKLHRKRREWWQKSVLRRLQPPPPGKDTSPYMVFRPSEKAHNHNTRRPPPPVNDTSPYNGFRPRKKAQTLDTRKVWQTLPQWLKSLLSQNFFNPCPVHHSSSKNEMNVFCFDCCLSLCRDCLSSHSTHRLLQIRRYVYHDVLKVKEAEKLFDCTAIQLYTVNGWKVVFLNKRDVTRARTISGNICTSCDRNIKDKYQYCSMSCKIDYILTEEGRDKLVNYLRSGDFLTPPDLAYNGHLTPDSVLETAAASSVNSYNSTGNTVVSTNIPFCYDVEADEKPAIEEETSNCEWRDCIERGMPPSAKKHSKSNWPEVLDHTAREKAKITTPTLGSPSPIPVLHQLDTASEPLRAQSIQYPLIQAVSSCWNEKRERWQKPVLRRLQPPPAADDTNPYKVFRPTDYEVFRPREKADKHRTRKRPQDVSDTNANNVLRPRGKEAHTQKTQQKLPEWLDSLLSQPFFDPCPVHHSSSKNEMNIFCVDCCLSICRFCVSSHSTHRLLQIRRYVYHDVLQLYDAEKLFDCTAIQPYTANGRKVVFLNQRETFRTPTTSENICTSCDRNVKDQYQFCSMSCKVDYILTEKGIDQLVSYLRRCDSLKLPDVAYDDQLMPDSDLEPAAASSKFSSNSSSTRKPVIFPLFWRQKMRT